jgi:sulfur carrier protein
MEDTPIKIVVNGRPRDIAPGTTVSKLLQALSVPATRVAVEHNSEIIRRPAFETVELAAGDRLEIVTLVGGG